MLHCGYEALWTGDLIDATSQPILVAWLTLHCSFEAAWTGSVQLHEQRYAAATRPLGSAAWVTLHHSYEAAGLEENATFGLRGFLAGLLCDTP